ncbi:hypothetical protein PQQ52_12330 [Paraburkholderia sediminicola]|uniref:hypothetical protein n=1 Tax=Paraburkholderia sediminicola TaxID=458836 RepID=UPI0038BC6A34
MTDLAVGEKSITQISDVPDSLRRFIVLSSEGGIDLPGLSTSADVAEVVRAAVDASPENGLVVFFHGGLDSESAGIDIVKKLKNSYHEEAKTYPIFFVWKSGLVETLEAMLKRKLTLIAKEKYFKVLRERIPRWSAKHISTSVGQERTAKIPNIVELEVEISADIATDRPFQESLKEVFEAAYGAKRGLPTTIAVLPDSSALNRMFPEGAALSGDSVLWKNLQLIRFLAEIVVNYLERIHHHRTHGLEPTIVEEILCAVYLNAVGADIWEDMKKSTERAFEPGKFAGTVLMEQLITSADSGRSFKKITLIGHSAGAIYASNFIKHAATVLPSLEFDVIFLAPAINYDDFSGLLSVNPAGIRNFRMFSMLELYESEDQLVTGVYIRSLLYFISGVLERDRLEDKPIFGMQRFLEDATVFDPAGVPNIEMCRRFLDSDPRRTVWSVTDGAPVGLNSAATTHGGFATEKVTMESVVYILTHGFGH